DRGVFQVYVVDETIVLIQSRLAPQLNDFGVRAVHAYAFIAVFAEDHRLAVFKIDHVVGPTRAFGEVFKRAVVEDVAILIDLDEGDAFVPRRRLNGRAQVLHINVERARDEGRFRCDG